MTINLNDYVSVTLTTAGATHLARVHAESMEAYRVSEYGGTNIRAGEVVRLQIWELCRDFGLAFGLGREPPIVDMEMTLEDTP